MGIDFSSNDNLIAVGYNKDDRHFAVYLTNDDWERIKRTNIGTSSTADLKFLPNDTLLVLTQNGNIRAYRYDYDRDLQISLSRSFNGGSYNCLAVREEQNQL